MRSPRYSKQFDRDTKLQKKRHKDLEKLRAALRLLLGGESMPAKFKDHPLSGEFSGFRECHLEPDWLIIYKLEDRAVYFVRTGTHSDLFD